jgi:hypothetical protein
VLFAFATAVFVSGQPMPARFALPDSARVA